MKDLAALDRVFGQTTPIAAPDGSPSDCPMGRGLRQAEAPASSPVWHGFTLRDLLRFAAPEDIPALDASPGLCKAFAWTLHLGELRQRGERPAHYTRRAICNHCGPVWLWEPGPAHVLGCPWCFNRANRLPIPRPLVTCGTCRFFTPNPSSPGSGIGSCGALPMPADTGPTCRPNRERVCGSWCPVA